MSLVGDWRLESLIDVSDESNPKYPYGKTPIGYLIISSSGLWSAFLMNSSRIKTDAEIESDCSKDEKASMVDTFSSYVGPYKLSGNEVTIHVEVSLFPGWVGKNLKRTISQLTDEELVLDARVMKGNKLTHNIVRWRRSGASTQVPTVGK